MTSIFKIALIMLTILVSITLQETLIEELESHICDILSHEASAHVKANISSVQETRVKGVNKIQLSKIWVVYE